MCGEYTGVFTRTATHSWSVSTLLKWMDAFSIQTHGSSFFGGVVGWWGEQKCAATIPLQHLNKIKKGSLTLGLGRPVTLQTKVASEPSMRQKSFRGCWICGAYAWVAATFSSGWSVSYSVSVSLARRTLPSRYSISCIRRCSKLDTLNSC